MNIRRFFIFILPVILIVGSIAIAFFLKMEKRENAEDKQIMEAERLFHGDGPTPIPVNETPEEYQNRLWREADVLLWKDIKGMPALDAAKYLYNESVPSHNDLFFEKINQAIEENPTFEALMFRGRAFWSLRDDKESARKDFAKATEIDPKSYKAHNELANVLYAMGNFDDAITVANKAIELGSKEAYSILYAVYYEKGEWKESLKYLRETHKYFPNDYSFFSRLEHLQSKIDKSEKRGSIGN